jgi:diguanylate cyclase (GGDEF)-like protein
MIDALNIGRFRGFVPKPLDLDHLRKVVMDSVKEYQTIFNDKEVLRQAGNALLRAREEINSLRRMMDGLVERQVTNFFAEGNLQNSRSFFYNNVNSAEQKQFLDVLDSGVLMLNEDASIRYCNPAFVELLNLPNLHLISSEDINFLAFTEVSQNPPLYDAITAVLRGEFVLATIQHLSAEHTVHLLDLSCSPVRQEDGNYKAIAMLQDRTQERQAIAFLSGMQKVVRLGEDDHNIETLLKDFLSICAQSLNANSAALYLLPEEMDKVTLISEGLSTDSINALQENFAKKSQTEIEQLFASLHTISAYDDVSLNAQIPCFVGIPEIQSAILSKITLPSDQNGLLCITSKRHRHFQEEETYFLKTVIAQIEDTVEKHQTLTDLESDASTDPITGLKNYRYFIRRASDLLKKRPGYTSLFMIDVDEFKLFNDRYGHQVGDEILRSIGNALLESTRSTDIVARYGGDEFIMLMTDCTNKKASEIINRIRHRLLEIPVPEDNSDQPPLSIDLSIGKITVDASNYLSLDEMIKKADIDMYRKKQFKVKSEKE